MRTDSKLPTVQVIRWEDPPTSRKSKGRSTDPYYDAILKELIARPGQFGRVGVFNDYSSALNVQQLMKNRGCQVTTRKDTVGTETKIDVWACWPANKPISIPASTLRAIEKQNNRTIRIFWGKVPKKKSGRKKKDAGTPTAHTITLETTSNTGEKND